MMLPFITLSLVPVGTLFMLGTAITLARLLFHQVRPAPPWLQGQVVSEPERTPTQLPAPLLIMPVLPDIFQIWAGPLAHEAKRRLAPAASRHWPLILS